MSAGDPKDRDEECLRDDTDLDMDESVPEDIDEGVVAEATGSQVGRKSITGQTCSLLTLIEDDVLEAGQSLLEMTLLGKQFIGDLMPNGCIRWTETKQVFSTPSSWVNHCRRSLNPESNAKATSAWSTIRYKGKRLDSYKLRWYRRQKKIIINANLMEMNQTTKSGADGIGDLQSAVACDSTAEQEVERLKSQNVVEHTTLGLRSHPIPDASLMVRCIPFSAIERIQPFTINVATNALLLIDFHCHLTSGEVTGYLSGAWDFASHCLTISQAFPCRSRLGDKVKAAQIEQEIRSNLEQRNLSLVGWYHSHPRSAPHPTIRDLETQLDYQIVMKGESDASYVPCVSLICSPYDPSNPGLESCFQFFWVMPPPEYRPYEYGRPMQMMYSVATDSFLTQDLLLEMRLLAHFYIPAPDAIIFQDPLDKKKQTTYWDKLKQSLTPNLPRDLQASEGQTLAQLQVQKQALSHFWAFVQGLLAPPPAPAAVTPSSAE